jgi:hypothetical protein
MLVFSALVVILLIAALALIPIGLREGDRAGDALPVSIEPSLLPRGIEVAVTNPGNAPVLLGLSLKRPGLRLRLESGTYARLRTRRTSPDLLPAQQAVIGVVAPGEQETFIVPAPPRLRTTAELVVVLGGEQRLRSIHRLVRLPSIDIYELPRPAERTAT